MHFSCRFKKKGRNGHGAHEPGMTRDELAMTPHPTCRFSQKLRNAFRRMCETISPGLGKSQELRGRSATSARARDQKQPPSAMPALSRRAGRRFMEC